jgi:hypothetical protein
VNAEVLRGRAADGRTRYEWFVTDGRGRTLDHGTAWTEEQAVTAAADAIDRLARKASR